MMKVLGLHDSNLKGYLDNYVEEDLKLFDLITLYNTTITFSRSFIRFKTRGFPSLLLTKEKVLRVLIESNNPNLLRVIELTVDQINPERFLELFSPYKNIQIIYEEETDFVLCNKYIISNNKEQLRKCMVEYNRDSEIMTEEERKVYSQLISMTELNLIKELAILKFEEEEIKDTVYMYLNIELVNNKMLPTINVLDLYNLSPHDVNNCCEYNKYALTLKQLFKVMREDSPINLKVTKEVFNFNVNSEFIGNKEIEELLKSS